MVVSVSNSAPNGVLIIAISKEAVINEEVRMKKQEIIYESQALVTKKKKRRGKNKSRGSHNRNDKSRD